MPDLVMFLCKSLLGWLAIQGCLTLVFLWSLQSSQQKLLLDDQLPKTAVILCLRGADPYLSDCLQALLKQNYPQYDLKIIVDHQEDPAWKIAVDTVQEQGASNVEISALTTVRNNCSLKCSSLLQAVSELDDSYKIVALVDADTVVHPNWLRELVSPLADPHVGATTGHRWYLPTGRYWGSLVRYIGNVSTVVQMYLFGVPWGGTLAIKTEVLRQTGLLDKWSQAFGEDMMIRSVLKKYGMQVKFVPSLMMLNQEECDLPSLRTSIHRQLLCARLYHPQWMAVVGDVISSILFPNLVLMSLLGALLTWQWESVALLLGYYGSYTLGLLWLMVILEQGVQQVIRDRNQPNQPLAKLSSPIIIRLLLGIPLTQWIYGLGMLSSLRISTVKWRGINYRISGPWNIRLLEYHPYQILDQPGDPKVSL
ncbi:MAG: glycosyltransferase family 2 protein [Mojavia pulchra JT2-VF2]|jgi:cellulose synthase/poly-beta-1,6-N-acetylglucosamine synthase-like glycosyltransferase|uniref:Glycosyltransferase family 2 protein n=1 Tax=Mojavia pulchra JT2-VF2 TaxID=287848 RepID=A0A951Q3Q0_9NOST|nr:glycosyltransferase family 2 protein [Mojavia pulchra JT2-VF2]